MTIPKTTVLLKTYDLHSDSFTAVINGEEKQVKAEDIFHYWATMKNNENCEPGESQAVQTSIEFSLGMIYEFHFNEEPSDLCWTWYEVAL